MADDLKAIAAEKVRKWQNLMELSEDPEFAPYLSVKAAPNGHSYKAVAMDSKHVASLSESAKHKNGASKPKAYMVNAVQGTFSRLQHEFTTGDIDRELKATPTFHPGAKNVNIAINDALGILRKRGLVEPTKRRRGFQRIWRKTQALQHGSAAESRTA
jgi:hypothetical protein